MNKILSTILTKTFNLTLNVFKKVQSLVAEKKAAEWFRDQGRLLFSKRDDKNLRYIYDLDENSVVFDVGGYTGQWTSDIFSMYRCHVYIFEPVDEFANRIKERFKYNKKIKTFGFGLGAQNQSIDMVINGDGSSVYKAQGQKQPATIRDIMDIIHKYDIEEIDLLKINIEGGEYDLLTRLIKTGYINNIRDIQVQFHDFVKNAVQKRNKLQKELSKTHFLTYQYPWVWENWRLKPSE